jgi:hypothetical protein
VIIEACAAVRMLENEETKCSVSHSRFLAFHPVLILSKGEASFVYTYEWHQLGCISRHLASESVSSGTWPCSRAWISSGQVMAQPSFCISSITQTGSLLFLVSIMPLSVTEDDMLVNVWSVVKSELEKMPKEAAMA